MKINEVDYIVKPCPFCGSTEIMIEKCTTRVRCKNCFAQSGLISKFTKKGVPEELAPLLAWNSRAYEKTNGSGVEGDH